MAAATTPNPHANTPPGFGARLGAAMAPGVATALAMWILWWLFHLPGFRLPPAVLVALLAITKLVALTAWARWMGRRIAWPATVAAGLIAALLNTLLLGSALVEQVSTTAELAGAPNRLRPGAAVGIVAFLAASAGVGAIAGLIGRVTAPRAQPPGPVRTLAALAVTTAVAFVPLIVVGGAVTSTDSGMAVPDAVTSYGAVSFLFPLSLMAGEWGEPRIFLEHTHRLFGSLVGLVTLLTLIWTWAVDRRPGPRWLAAAVFALVCVQGLLGALRVGENSAWLAMAHGAFGQGVFASGVALAAVLTAAGRSTVPEPTARLAGRVRGLAGVALACTGLQLLLGAMSRHMGAAHATWSHAAFAFIVATAVGLLGLALRGADGSSPAGRAYRLLGAWVMGLIAFQFALGFVVLWEVMSNGPSGPIPTAPELATAPPPNLTEAVLATLHQTNGAAVLALVTLAAVWSWAHGSVPTPGPAPAPAPARSRTDAAGGAQADPAPLDGAEHRAKPV